jgi:hypothetical protein
MLLPFGTDNLAKNQVSVHVFTREPNAGPTGGQQLRKGALTELHSTFLEGLEPDGKDYVTI